MLLLSTSSSFSTSPLHWVFHSAPRRSNLQVGVYKNLFVKPSRARCSPRGPVSELTTPILVFCLLPRHPVCHALRRRLTSPRSLTWIGGHTIRINKPYRIIKRIIVRTMPAHLISQRINRHPSCNRRIIHPCAVIQPIQIQLVLQFLPVVLVVLRRSILSPVRVKRQSEWIVIYTSFSPSLASSRHHFKKRRCSSKHQAKDSVFAPARQPFIFSIEKENHPDNSGASRLRRNIFVHKNTSCLFVQTVSNQLIHSITLSGFRCCERSLLLPIP